MTEPPLLSVLRDLIVRRQNGSSRVSLDDINNLATAAGEARCVIQLADEHIQAWRGGMAELLLAAGYDQGVLDAVHKLKGLPGWRALEQASLGSAAVMAELRPYWGRLDEVETR